MDEERLVISHHEAGHAAAALALEVRFEHVELDPVTGAGRLCRDSSPGLPPLTEAMLMLAGPVAQVICYTSPSWTGAEYPVSDFDWDRLYELLAAVQTDPDPGYYRRLGFSMQQLLMNHWPAVAQIALALAERGRLTYAEALALWTAHAALMINRLNLSSGSGSVVEMVAGTGSPTEPGSRRIVA
jgi:hypothetical protein